MLALRDALAEALWVDGGGIDDCAALWFPEANAILATPEMQAIRNALHGFAASGRGMPTREQQRLSLRNAGLPGSVIEWVIS